MCALGSVAYNDPSVLNRYNFPTAVRPPYGNFSGVSSILAATSGVTTPGMPPDVVLLASLCGRLGSLADLRGRAENTCTQFDAPRHAAGERDRCSLHRVGNTVCMRLGPGAPCKRSLHRCRTTAVA